MKKSLSSCLFVFLSSLLFAQKVEIVKKIPFGTEDSFNYWTKWDPNEGGRSGLNLFAVLNGEFYILNDFTFYKSEENKYDRKIKMEKSVYSGSALTEYIPDGLVYGYYGAGYPPEEDKNEFIILHKDKEMQIRITNKDFGRISYNKTYYTDNTVFFMTDTKDLVSIQLYEDGTYRTRGIEETKEYLENGKTEELGVDFRLNKKGKVSRICIGDYSLNPRSDGINYWKKRIGKFKMMNPKYEDKNNLTEFEGETLSPIYDLKGFDSKGLHYFLRFDCEKGNYSEDIAAFNVKFSIAVMDLWEDKVYFYEDYKVNEWNPPRDAEGKTLCSTSWTVAPDGNIYFTDCDLGNKEWLIKKIPNRWYEEIGINNRHIGRFTVNHVPLYVDASKNSETNGFNFENDIIWEKETKGEWSRIQKLDGREGWVQTKYIAFD